MSGLEIAGVLLGSFPLIISGLEHWRDVAKVAGFWWRVRQEHNSCLRDVQYQHLLYKRNLKELLSPIVNDPNEVDGLINDPGGKDWQKPDLQKGFARRLSDAYDLYMGIIQDMNQAAAQLKRELSPDNPGVQDKLKPPELKRPVRSSSPQPQVARPNKPSSLKMKIDYQAFRVKFSFSEPVRKELFGRLQECNKRLEKLLSTSDKLHALESTNKGRQTHVLESTMKLVWKKSDNLFQAIQQAWQCSCEQFHYASLRLEHRTVSEICFDIILTYIAPSSPTKLPWSWRQLQCGVIADCSLERKLADLSLGSQTWQRAPTIVPAPPVPAVTSSQKRVAFEIPASGPVKMDSGVPLRPKIELCQLLSNQEQRECVGTISYRDDAYHLHNAPQASKTRCGAKIPVALDTVLSRNFDGRLTRRQRYRLALLVASSVAQLQFTPWLRTDLTKRDVFFFPGVEEACSTNFHEPFVRQNFSPQALHTASTKSSQCNFASLGILLLELCFGRRLDDHPARKRFVKVGGEAEQAFDLKAARDWTEDVHDEAGCDYESAVKWCFITSARKANDSWRSEIIENVIRPLEKCQEHFKSVAAC